MYAANPPGLGIDHVILRLSNPADAIVSRDSTDLPSAIAIVGLLRSWLDKRRITHGKMTQFVNHDRVYNQAETQHFHAPVYLSVYLILFQ